MTVIDAHVHYWEPSRNFDIKPIADKAFYRRNFLSAHLAGDLAGCGIGGIQLVQSAPDTAETAYLADLARGDPLVLGLTGWVDLDAPELEVAALSDLAPLNGVRLQLRRHADPDYAARPQVVANMRRLLEAGYGITLLAEQQHHPALTAALAQLPDLPMVINHCGMPGFASDWTGWAEALAAYARRTQMFVQFSGIPANFGENWRGEQALASMRHILACFGRDRMVFASDWPMLLPWCGYGEWFDAAEQFLRAEGLSGDDLDAVFGRNAMTLHALTVPSR